MKEKKFFDDIYKKYNIKDFVYSDPIQFPLKFKEKNNIEIVALISSSFAYGNVKQIIASLNKIFSRMKEPYRYIKNLDDKKVKSDFYGFKHRFSDFNELGNFLLNIKRIYEKYPDIETAFKSKIKKDDRDVSNAIYLFVDEFCFYKTPTLIPDPSKKSAFKRFNLFLRWLVREDEIDIGIWKNIDKRLLIIPLDTHMHQISKELGITKRNDTSMRTAIEITDFFKKINPEDPLKYDFSLTRAPILKNFK